MSSNSFPLKNSYSSVNLQHFYKIYNMWGFNIISKSNNSNTLFLTNNNWLQARQKPIENVLFFKKGEKKNLHFNRIRA